MKSGFTGSASPGSVQYLSAEKSVPKLAFNGKALSLLPRPTDASKTTFPTSRLQRKCHYLHHKIFKKNIVLTVMHVVAIRNIYFVNARL